MNKFTLLFSFSLIMNLCYSQSVDSVKIKFKPVFNDELLDLTEESSTLNTGSHSIKAFKFYVSNVQFYKEDSLMYAVQKSAHLLDASAIGGLTFIEEIPKNLTYSSIKFNLGIDSITNVSGVMGGDLDPTTGMYWTWQSGYINLKLEGINPLCPTRGNKYNFHIGGYQSPYNTLQQVELSTNTDSTIIIKLDLDLLFEKVDLKQMNEIMSPTSKAVEFSDLLPSLFSIVEQ